CFCPRKICGSACKSGRERKPWVRCVAFAACGFRGATGQEGLDDSVCWKSLAWRAWSLVLPLHEALDGVELGQAQLIVGLGRVAVAVLRALPELARIQAAREHRPVLLRLMAEDGELLLLDVLRPEGDDALDLVRSPLLPGAAVEPDLEGLPALA